MQIEISAKLGQAKGERLTPLPTDFFKLFDIFLRQLDRWKA